MKVLFVAPYFYPKVGGLENYVYNIGKNLAKKHEVIIVTSNHINKHLKIDYLENMKIYKLPITFKLSNTPINLLWIFQVNKILKLEKPDVINAHTPVPFLSEITLFLARFKKIPLYLTYHSGEMKKENRSYLNVIIWIYEAFVLRAIFKLSKKIICYGSTGDYLGSRFGLDNNKIVEIPPGVDSKKFKKIKSLDKLKNNILYLGKMDSTARWKGLDYLFNSIISLLKEGYDLNFNLVGEGDMVDYYSKKYSGLSDKIHFLGPQKYDHLPIIFSQNSLLVLPSVTPSESFGMVLIEANSCELPVIGSKVGGIPYVIKNGYNGILVPPKDVKLLKAAIKNLLNDKSLSKKMGQNGRKMVLEKFSWKKSSSKTELLFGEVQTNENCSS